ncbi:MAG: complex I subunit 5 family protein [Treponema sp.]|nr:complex I subunit 5 family protein [Treponema sp.]
MTGNILLLTVIFFPIAAAFAAYFAGRKSERARDVIVFAAVVFTFAASLVLALRYQGVELRLADWGALALHFRADGFRVLYACVTAFLWLVTSIFTPEYLAHSHNRSRYWFFNLITFGAVTGVFFSADFRTAFLFFEIMTFSSYVLVAHNETHKTLRASDTYLAVAIISGLVQVMGLALLQYRAGTLEFAALHELFTGMADKSLFYLPGALLLLGFGAKAGMYPLHFWLPKAYPAAPAPAAALLSGVLSKAGVFGLVVLAGSVFMNDHTWAAMLLIPAAVTMVFGAVLAVFSDNLKRTLACSSISQVGFILTGVAMLAVAGGNNALAAHGTLLHMLNHSLFKLLLFLAAGVVYMNRRELALDKIRGFGRGKPLFFFVFVMAALGICGVPLWSGHVSKTLLHKALADGLYLYQGLSLEVPLRLSYIALTFTGGLTFAYMARLFVTLFVEKSTILPAVEEKRYISVPSAVALAVAAALVPLLGSFTWLMDALALWGQDFFHAHAPSYAMRYFAWTNMQSTALSLVIGALVYFVFVRGLVMRRRLLWPFWLDIEVLIYRPLLNLLTLNTFLRSSGRKPHTLGRLLSLYTLQISRRLRLLHENPAIIGHFSLDLLLVGMGVCIAIVYVFIRSLG